MQKMTKKDIEKILLEFEPELKANIESATSDIKVARSLATKLTNLYDKAVDIGGKLEHPLTGVDAKLSSANESVDKIELAVSSSVESLNVIESNLQKVQTDVDLMKSSYAEFEIIKAKIDDPANGLEALLSEVKASKAKAQSAATRSNSLIVEIETSFTKIQSYITEINSAYSNFTASKAKIDDPASGLEAVLQGAQSIHDEISAVNKTSQTLYAEISKFKTEAAKNIASIQAIRDDSDNALNQIKQHEADSEAVKERISSIYQLVSQTGHASRFDSRAKELLKSSWYWFGFGGLSLIVAVLIAIFWITPLLHTDGNDLEMRMMALLLLRTLIVTPIIAFAIFAFGQFNKDRKLSEQYAFKAVSAATLEGSISLISRSLGSIPDEKLANFAINAATNLHIEPTELHSKTKFSLKANSKIIDVVAEVSDSLDNLNQSIDDIKSFASKNIVK